MKKEKEKKQKSGRVHRKMDGGEIFVKVMAGILAIFMVAGTAISLIFALIEG